MNRDWQFEKNPQGSNDFEEMVAVVERIKEQGYDVVTDQDGTYTWNKPSYKPI